MSEITIINNFNDLIAINGISEQQKEILQQNSLIREQLGRVHIPA